MGLKCVNKAQEDFLIKNHHTLLMKDQDLKHKYETFLNIDLIPDLYKKNRIYYNNFENMSSFIYPTEADEDLGSFDQNFIDLVKNLFNYNISPGLLDDDQLRNQPNTVILVCEHDTRKDEALIYAERLRLAGNSVQVKYYEKGFHGIIMAENSLVSIKMRHDLINFIRNNL